MTVFIRGNGRAMRSGEKGVREPICNALRSTYGLQGLTILARSSEGWVFG